MVTLSKRITHRPYGGWGRVGQIVLTPSAAVWVEDVDRDGYQVIVRATDGGWGSDRTVLRSETGDGALFFPAIDANDSVVAYMHLWGQGEFTNATTSKLMQLRIGSDAAAKRMSCNRGEQSNFALNEKTGAVWVDATLGTPTLEYRAAPTNGC